MGKHWSYFIFLVWLSSLMTIGLLLFTEGFLLNRVSRVETSHCSSTLKLNDSSFHEIYQNPEKAGTVCLGRQARVVLLVVDALKHEFALWDEQATNDVPHHRNKLPIIHELLKQSPRSSRLYKFIADPPTTTMQRLKALTTGTLPTFIDVGSNFATEEINEDNLIDQIAKMGVVFMGDDTWTGLFPNRFLRQYPLPSFNVWDLDTVDSGVRGRIVPEMKAKDWSLMIAHVLGVDHCGHRYGPNHPEMARKLRDTDHLIRAIVDNLDQDMMLFVVGDHGMTTTGDHGGDSRAEVEAAMFVYSKMPLLHGALADVEEVRQIDLVPTLASILGVAVPFSNIGTVVLGSLPSISGINTTVDGFQYALHSLWSNVVQARRYLERYSSDTYLFSSEKLNALEIRYNILSRRLDAIRDAEKFEFFAAEAKTYLKRIRDMCEEVWVQFDFTLMKEGLALMLSTIILSFLLIEGIPGQSITQVFSSVFLMRLLMATIGAALLASVLFHFGITEKLRATVFFFTGIVSIAALAVQVLRNSGWDNGRRWRRWRWSTLCAWLVLAASIYSLFSNSYVVEEGTVLAFLIVTLIWFMVWDSGFENQDVTVLKVLKFRELLIVLGVLGSVSLRLSSYFWRCREEQQRSCGLPKSSETRSPLLNSLNDVIVLSNLGVLALYVMAVGRWLRRCGVTGGFLPGGAVVRYSPGIILGCMGCFWILQRLPKNAKVKFFLPWKADVLPVIIYFLTLLGILSLYRRPFSGHRALMRTDHSGHVAPRVSEQRMKDESAIEKSFGQGDPCATYSATFTLLSVFLTLLVALLLGDILAPSAVLMGVVCTSILGISALERWRNAVTIVDLLEVPTPSLICWFLTAESYFYGTGHQAAFPTIQWEAAFVGTGGHFYSNAIPAALIVINTFGSHIVLGASLPLMVVVPFTLLLVFPSLANLNAALGADLRRGELLLYEHSADMFAATVAVSGRYMLLHGIRAFGCMVAATVHSRHLMVWKIFAPKFIFEGLGLLVTLGSVLISFLLVMRINHQIERVLTRLNKTS